MRNRLQREIEIVLAIAAVAMLFAFAVFRGWYLEITLSAVGLYLLVRLMLAAIAAWERSVLGDEDKRD